MKILENEEKKVEDWDIDQVANWLKNMSISEEIIDTFKENEINGKTLIELNGDELKNDLGIKQLGRRKQLLEEIDKLKTSKDVKSDTPKKQENNGSDSDSDAGEQDKLCRKKRIHFS